MRKMILLLMFGIATLITFAPAGFCDYQIVWSTMDGGGTSAGGQYKLTGIIGQPSAGYSEGGSYELLGGFWPGGPLCFVNFADFAAFADYWLQSGAELPADLDGNGTVDFGDLELFVSKWLCTCPYNWPLHRPPCFVNFADFATFAEYWLQSGTGLPADLDGNGVVDFGDLELFVYNWLCTCPYNWPL